MKISKKYLTLLVLLFGVFTGCTRPIEEEIVVQTQTGDDEIPFKQSYVERNDVIKTQNIKCTYKETLSQSVKFPVTGKLVDKVYVREGDTVSKGDLLCELSAGDLEDSIATFEYNITRNELLLGYLDKWEALDKQDVWIATQGNDQDYINKRYEDIEKNYSKKRTTYNDSLEFDRKKLDELYKEYRDSKIYSTIDGTVYYVKPNLVGATSKADVEVMTVVSNSDCLFSVSETEFADLFKEGEAVDMTITTGSASGEYVLLPYRMGEWDDELLFEVIGAPENEGIDVGTNGTISVVLESAENVISVPTSVIYQADEGYFVYVLNSDNFRDIRWVKTGLFGDKYVEITEGLSEGEIIVKK